MIKFAAALFVLGLTLVSSPVGVANEPTKSTCESRTTVLDFLSTRYSEAPVAMGLSKAGVVGEILPAGPCATCTIMVRTPDGLTCMVAAGDSWESVAPRVQPRQI